ncbi:MAG: type II secretory protein, partial [Ignisphaera sp.]
MSEFGKSIAEYSIGYGDNVIVSIVELSDGKLLYIVKEPLLDDVGKKFRERVYRFITNDVEIIKKISSFTSFDEGYDFVKDLVQKLCKKFIGKCSDSVISSIVYYVLRDFIGYGEVDPLIRDPNIEDVTCDGHDRPIYVFHNKYEWLETNKVLSREELEKVIRRLTYRAGKEASVAQPIVEGILNPEGYRIHVVLDVVSMSGHSFTIR